MFYVRKNFCLFRFFGTMQLALAEHGSGGQYTYVVPNVLIPTSVEAMQPPLGPVTTIEVLWSAPVPAPKRCMR